MKTALRISLFLFVTFDSIFSSAGSSENFNRTNGLAEYAYTLCLASVLSTAGGDYAAAGEALRASAWWYVENSDAAPEVYDRIYKKSLTQAAPVSPQKAAAYCHEWSIKNVKPSD